MDEAVQADRIVIMDKEKVFLDGTSEQVFSNVGRIRAINLDVPLAVEIAENLRSRGVDVPRDIITNERLADYICRYM